MNVGRNRLSLAVLVCLGLLAYGGSVTAQENGAPVSPGQITQILASPDRSAADRTNDLRRHPQQMLEFIGIRPGIVAVDLSAAGGYTTELLARTIGPSGTVYGQSRPRDPDKAPVAPAASEGNSHPNVASNPLPTGGPRPSPVALADRQEKLRAAAIPAAPIIAVIRPFEDPMPPELAADHVDLVTLMFNYHDLGFMECGSCGDEPCGVPRAEVGRSLRDRRSRRPARCTGISESGTLHRIEETFLRQEVEAAGFRLLAEGDFLRNPNDPRDKNTPDPPQPKDEFVLKFVKP